jgi:hypothetical protein
MDRLNRAQTSSLKVWINDLERLGQRVREWSREKEEPLASELQWQADDIDHHAESLKGLLYSYGS